MTLVDEYLRAVAALLPKDEREDIVAELRDMILNKIEGRESELGRALTPEETEALLRDIGHPLVVAARYRGGSQHVVGPALYPFWFFLVKVSLLIVAAVAAITLLGRLAAGWDLGFALGRSIAIFFDGGLTVIGSVTAAAWVIEQFKIKLPYLDNWRVRDLRIFEYAGWGPEVLREGFSKHPSRRAGREARSESRKARYGRYRPWRSLAAEGLMAIAWGAVFMLWWVGLLPFGLVGDNTELDRLGLTLGPLGPVDWAAFKLMVFAPVLALAAGVVLRGAAMLCYPATPALRGLLDLFIGGGTIALCAWLWTVSPIASAVQFDSVAELVVRVTTAFQHNKPLDISPLITVFLVFWTFGGVTQVLRGAWLIIARPGGMRDIAAA